jgi:thiamine biosynthesis lipoprotein
MGSDASSTYILRETDSHWIATYTAMASPCEIHLRCDRASEAEQAASLACSETHRIEQKFSRYRNDSVVHAINHGDGAAVAVDEETARLLRYAGQCYELSEGRFDITSGVLRKAWSFNGAEVTPDRALIASLCARVGWERVRFDGASVRLERGMEIDLGGIGKEYAADRVADLVTGATGASVMVNLGGDIRVISAGVALHSWKIGIEDPSRDGRAVGELEMWSGAVATSGDARRFCLIDGVRASHILDPHTGWPVAGAPRSVTVIADTCTAAGFLATLAMLNGPDAESFLAAQDVKHHCIR